MTKCLRAGGPLSKGNIPMGLGYGSGGGGGGASYVFKFDSKFVYCSWSDLIWSLECILSLYGGDTLGIMAEFHQKNLFPMFN